MSTWCDRKWQMAAQLNSAQLKHHAEVGVVQGGEADGDDHAVLERLVSAFPDGDGGGSGSGRGSVCRP